MRPHRATRLLLVATLLAACAPAAVSSVTPAASPSRPAATASASPPLPVIAPEAAIAVTQPGWIAFDGTTLWVFSTNGSISRINPLTNTISAPTVVDPTWDGGGFAMDKSGLWVADFLTSLVYRVDPSSLAVVAKIRVGANPDGAGVAADAVWIANHRGGSVTRIDPATNKVVAEIMLNSEGPSGPHQFGFGLGSVWVSAGNPPTDTVYVGTVMRIDPATNKVQATIDLPEEASACGGFAITQLAVWTASCGDTTILVRIDPSTNKVVATIDLGGYASDVPLMIGDNPWFAVANVSGAGPARLVRIDPASNTIDRELSLGDAFTDGGEGLLQAAGSAWVTDFANNQVLRLPLAAFTQ